MKYKIKYHLTPGLSFLIARVSWLFYRAIKIKKHIYLSLINLEIANRSCEKILIPLKAKIQGKVF
jgi:hypothetical protein